MKLYSFLIISCVLCFCVLQATSMAYAQDQTPAGGPGKIKAMLLRPTGWSDDWSGHELSGKSELMFEARGEKIVVSIQTPLFSVSCERDVTITSDAVKYDGCTDPEQTLLFDPNDQDYPFKGRSPRGIEHKLRPK